MAVRVGAIIVAAGAGARMEGVDKLFVPLSGRPLLARTVAAVQECSAVQTIVLVLSPANLDRGQKLVQSHGFDKVERVCSGGPRRQDSVRLGLEALGPCDFVAVHDGARPLVTPDLILRALDAARETGAAVPALPLADTVKEASADGVAVRTLDRSRLWAVQTPQVFRYELLLRAHHVMSANVTDDAAMVEGLGESVRLFPGEPCNIKVTLPENLAMVRGLQEA